MKALRRAVGRLVKLNAKALLVLLTLVFDVLLLIINSSFSYRTAADIVLTKTDAIERDTMQQIDSRMQLAVDEIERLLGKLTTGGRIIAYLTEFRASESTYDMLQVERNMLNYLSGVQEVYSSISSINIYIQGHSFISNGPGPVLSYDSISESGITRQINESDNQALMMPPGYLKPASGFNPDSFSFWSVLKNAGGENNGYILVVMTTDWLDVLFRSQANAVLMDKAAETVLWHGNGLPEEDLAGLNGVSLQDGTAMLNTASGRRYSVRTLRPALSDWTVLSLQDTRTFDGEMNEILLYSLLSYALGMVLCVLAALYFSRVITRPVSLLTDAAQQYKAGEPYRPLNIRRNRLSLRSMFMLYFTLIAAVPLLVNVLSLSFTLYGIIERKVVASLEQNIAQTAGNINYFVDINERISKSIVTDRALREYLVEVIEARDGADIRGSLDEVLTVISDSMYLGKGVFDTSLYGQDGNLLYSTSNFNRTPLAGERLKSLSASRATPVWVSGEMDEFGRNVLKLYREVKDDGSLRDGQYWFKTVGYICVTYYETDLEKLYGEYSLGNDLAYIVDADGAVISHRDKQLLGMASGVAPGDLPASGIRRVAVDAPGGKRMLVLSRCTVIPWVLVIELPYADVMAENGRILYSNIVVFSASLFVIIVISSFLSRRITRPVGRLLSALVGFAEGDRQVVFEQRGSMRELAELGGAFDKMARQINELIEQVYESKLRESELENERRQSELVALKAQINPHFLYNTLESIIWLVRMGDKEKAADMLSMLGDFFRTGVKKGNEFIRVSDEIEFERIYLSIYEGRMGDKLKVAWDIDERLADYLVPKTILQPIMENAIYHGVQENEAGGTVSVACFEREGCLVFTVRDDGPGIPEDKLAEINDRLNRDLAGDSIGIYNVQKRLRLYYGGDWGIVIHSREGEGTTVTMRLPVLHAADTSGGLLA